MHKGKFYLAGKIDGDENYLEKFKLKSNLLRDMGYVVEDPTSYGVMEGWTWNDYMKRDIPLLLQCDGIVLIEDWRSSRGSIMEYDTAKRLGLVIKFFHGNEVKDTPVLGMKFSNHKVRWDLVNLKYLEGMVDVLEYGANKYSIGNYKVVANAYIEYMNALKRHIIDFCDGDRYDKESGLHLLDHVLCNAYILRDFEYEKENAEEKASGEI